MERAQLSFQKQCELVERFLWSLGVDDRGGWGTHGGSGRDCSHRPGRLAQGVPEHYDRIYGLRKGSKGQLTEQLRRGDGLVVECRTLRWSRREFDGRNWQEEKGASPETSPRDFPLIADNSVANEKSPVLPIL